MVQKQNKRYPLHQCLLFGTKSKTKLADHLQVTRNALESALEVQKYNTFEKDGRAIQQPIGTLAHIHSRFKKLLSSVETPAYLHSGIKRRSAITNALVHKEGKYALTLDIKSFYQSADREYVFRFLHHGLNMQTNATEALTQLLTYESFIPTGSAASQILAFWAYKDFFDEIHALTLNFGMVFSLYVDDISISSQNPLPRNFHIAVNKILQKANLRLKLRKTKYYGPSDFKSYTGCIVTPRQEIEVPNIQKQKFIFAVRELAKHPNDSTLNQSALGSLNHMQQIQKPIFQSFRPILETAR